MSSTLIHFDRSLSKIGAKLSNGYGIKCPHNAVGSLGISDAKNEACLKAVDPKIELILGDLKEFQAGKIEKTSVFEAFSLIKQLPHVLKLLGILIFKGTSSLAFHVTEDCTKCHQCQKICPVSNIEWDRDKPKFGNRCASCFACLQWCPHAAIHFGKYSLHDMGVKHYHHPSINASDFIMHQQNK